MNNNNQQKRYFSPNRVFLYSIAAFIYILHAHVCYGFADGGNLRRLRRSADPAAGYGKDSIMIDSSESNDGATNDDSAIDAVYAENAAEDGYVQGTGNRDTGISKKDDSVKDHGTGITTGQAGNAAEINDKPDTFEYDEIFGLSPDQIMSIIKNVSSEVGKDLVQGDGSRVTGISRKDDSSKSNGTGDTTGKKTNDDTNRGQGNYWSGFDTANEFIDPFNKQYGVFDGNKKYKIPGLAAMATAATKSSAINYIIIIAFFLLVN